MNISNINCENPKELKKIELNDLKHICRQYGLNDHGTKISLCSRIQSYLKNITGTKDTYLDINNIKKIHSIYDLVAVLKIDDLSEIHDLDEYEVEFLFNEIKKKYPEIENDMDKLIKKYPVKDIERGDIDVKMLIITDYLGRMICQCIDKYQPKLGIKSNDICQRSIIKNRDLKISQYKCDSKSATILPKFGSRKVIGYED